MHVPYNAYSLNKLVVTPDEICVRKRNISALMLTNPFLCLWQAVRVCISHKETADFVLYVQTV